MTPSARRYSIVVAQELGYRDLVLPRLPCSAGHGGAIFCTASLKALSNSLASVLASGMVFLFFPACPVPQGMAGLFFANPSESLSFVVNEQEIG